MSPRVDGMEPSKETEMSRLQVDMVENCFEEGQYETALSILNELRSPLQRPPTSLLRAVILLARCPPTFSQDKATIDPTASPSKLIRAQRSQSLWTPEVTRAAQRLLLAFARTNSPTRLFEAVPSFENPATIEKDDFGLGLDMVSISQAKSCWDMLEENFMNINDSFTPFKNKRSRKNIVEDDAEVAPVCDSGWPLLEWYTVIFERDEALQAETRYSQLLLQQLPLPRVKSELRWDASLPLNVVFFCFSQRDDRRKSFGHRLLTLLIHLVMAQQIDLPRFLRAVQTRTASLTEAQLTEVLSGIPMTPPCSHFKVLLLHRLISSTQLGQGPSSPKPSARPQPKARSRVSISQETHDKPTQQSLTSVQQKTSLPSALEILRLLRLAPATSSHPFSQNYLRFQLIMAFGNLRSLSPETDPDWADVKDGTLSDALKSAFGSEDEQSQTFRLVIEAAKELW